MNTQPEPKRPKLQQQKSENNNEDDAARNVKSMLAVIKKEQSESSISVLETDYDIIGPGTSTSSPLLVPENNRLEDGQIIKTVQTKQSDTISKILNTCSVQNENKKQLDVQLSLQQLFENQQKILANQELLLQEVYNKKSKSNISAEAIPSQEDSQNISFIRLAKSCTAIFSNDLVQNIFVAKESDGKLKLMCNACETYNAK